MRRAIATFQLLVSLSWVLGLAWLFMTLASVTTAVSTGALVIYWGSFLSGPLLLMAASIILMLDRRGRIAASYIALLASTVLVGLSLFWVGPAVIRYLKQGEYTWAAPLGCFVVASVLSALAAFMQVVAVRRLSHAAGTSR